jgi:hypothetical protein
MMQLRKLGHDNLVLIAIGTVAFFAIALEQDIATATKVMAGLVYAGFLASLGSSALSFLADRRQRFTRSDYYLVVYSALYAIFGFILSRPNFVFFSIVGLGGALVIWLAVRLFARQT